MAVGNVRELRPKAGSESEKITINLGYVDLGHIDLLVQDGFYTNRTDFIRTAIRKSKIIRLWGSRAERRSMHLVIPSSPPAVPSGRQNTDIPAGKTARRLRSVPSIRASRNWPTRKKLRI